MCKNSTAPLGEIQQLDSFRQEVGVLLNAITDHAPAADKREGRRPIASLESLATIEVALADVATSVQRLEDQDERRPFVPYDPKYKRIESCVQLSRESLKRIVIERTPKRTITPKQLESQMSERLQDQSAQSRDSLTSLEEPVGYLLTGTGAIESLECVQFALSEVCSQSVEPIVTAGDGALGSAVARYYRAVSSMDPTSPDADSESATREENARYKLIGTIERFKTRAEDRGFVVEGLCDDIDEWRGGAWHHYVNSPNKDFMRQTRELFERVKTTEREVMGSIRSEIGLGASQPSSVGKEWLSEIAVQIDDFFRDPVILEQARELLFEDWTKDAPDDQSKAIDPWHIVASGESGLRPLKIEEATAVLFSVRDAIWVGPTRLIPDPTERIESILKQKAGYSAASDEMIERSRECEHTLWRDSWKQKMDRAECFPLRARETVQTLLREDSDYFDIQCNVTEGDAEHGCEPAQGSNPQYLFRKEGESWKICFGDQERGIFRDSKGMRIIDALLKAPNPSIPIDAAELLGREPIYKFDEAVFHEAIDPEDVKNLKHRLSEYPEEIELARKRGDENKAQRLEHEMSKLKSYLRQSQGLGGKPRDLNQNSAAESARTSVKANINRVLKRFKECDHPMNRLAEHLDASIFTEGNAYAYRPLTSIDWQFQESRP